MPPDAPATEQAAATSGPDIGLDADEQAVYDSMKSEPAPTGDPGHVEPEAPAEPVAATPEPAVTPGSEPPIAGAVSPVQSEDDADDDADPAPLADGTKPPKRVSFNKFKRAEDDAKAAAAELKNEREKNAKAAENQARLDERLRLINEALTTQPAVPVDEDPEPDPEADIFGHNAWLKRQLLKTQTSLSEFREQVETGQQASQADQRLSSTYMDDAARFAQTEPNFGPAYVYLMNVRVAQIASQKPYYRDLSDPNVAPLTASELSEIKTSIANEEKGIVSAALKAGKSPAQAVFLMARATGYRPAPPAPTNGALPPAPTSTAPPVPAPPNGAAKPSVTAVIDGIKKGQDAALSLSHGGGTPAPVLNMEKLASMPQDEFAELLNNMTPEGLRRAMGGGP